MSVVLASRRIMLSSAPLPETSALVAAMTVRPPSARIQLVDRTIRAMKAAGLWTKYDILYVLAAHHEQAARLNWKAPGSFTLTAVNSPTFTIDRGFTGDGVTAYLATGYDPSAVAGAMTLNDAHVTAVNVTQGTSAANLDIYSNNNRLSLRLPRTANSISFRLNAAASSLGAGGITPPAMASAVRREGTTQYAFVNGAPHASGAAASAALPTIITVLGNPVLGSYQDKQIASVSLGSAKTDAEEAADYAIRKSYLGAVGVTLP